MKTIKQPTQPSNARLPIEPVEGSASEESGETKEYEKHEVEGAAETLMKAHQMKHMTPKLHAHAMEHLKHMNKAMSEMMAQEKPKDLEDLRKIAAKKSAE